MTSILILCISIRIFFIENFIQNNFGGFLSFVFMGNSSFIFLKVMELNWGEDASMLGPVDVVLLSDLFYDPEEALSLAKTLHSVWAEGTRGYAASEVRDGVEECLKILRQEGFKIENVVQMTRPLIRDSAQTAVFAVYVVSRMNVQ